MADDQAVVVKTEPDDIINKQVQPLSDGSIKEEVQPLFDVADEVDLTMSSDAEGEAAITSGGLKEIDGIPVEFVNLNLVPVEQYLAENAPPPRPSPPKITSSRKTRPPVPLDPSTQTTSDGIEMIVSQTVSSQNCIDFYLYAQKHHPRLANPEFIYTEEYKGEFSVICRFGEPHADVTPAWMKGVNGEGPKLFTSKKKAKDDVAGVALEYLKNLPPSAQSVILRDEKNYIDMLNVYCSRNKLGLPIYTDYATKSTPHAYGSQLQFALSDIVFGSPSPLFANKKLGKNAAAKEAIDWLEAEKGIKVLSAHVSGNSATARKVQALRPGSVIEIDVTDKPAGEVIQEICPSLGFKSPRFDIIKKVEMEGMYDIFAILDRPPPHENKPIRLGPHKNIYGRKNAKDEMNKVLLRFFTLYARNHLKVELKLVGTYAFEPLRHI